MHRPLTHTETDDTDTDRAVSFTIDALFMTLFLVGGLLLAFQFAPNPNAETESELAEMRFESEITDLVAIESERGNLEDALLYWDDSAGTWANAGGDDYYTTVGSGHPLTEMTSTLDGRGMNYGITVEYLDDSGATFQEELINQGAPGSEATVASQSFVLEDSTPLVGPDSGKTVKQSSSFYAPDAFPESDTYNIITVYVVVWQN
jgi:hypothetical protein